MKFDTVIKNGRVITASSDMELDIGIIDDRIAALG